MKFFNFLSWVCIIFAIVLLQVAFVALHRSIPPEYDFTLLGSFIGGILLFLGFLIFGYLGYTKTKYAKK